MRFWFWFDRLRWQRTGEAGLILMADGVQHELTDLRVDVPTWATFDAPEIKAAMAMTGEAQVIEIVAGRGIIK
jgi:hypothetical protein